MLQAIEKYKEKCNISHIWNENCLRGIFKTALPWTTVPLSVCVALNKMYLETALGNENVSAVITTPGILDDEMKRRKDKALVVAQDAEALFYLLHMDRLHAIQGMKDNFVTRSIAATAVIDPSARIGHAVTIGENVHIGPFCVIENNVVIGDDCWVGPHCSIGLDAFFPRRIGGVKRHIPGLGGVRMGQRCRLHGHNIVASSSYYAEYTEIGNDVFLGFQSTVGHDARIRDRVNASTKAMIAGRVNIGEDAWIGAGASISNSLQIGNKASVKIGAVVIDNVADKASVSGNFALAHQKNLARKIKADS